MNVVTALPRALGVEKISAYTPPMTETGVEAPMPTKSRMITRLAKLGANALPRLKAMKTTNVDKMTYFRP